MSATTKYLPAGIVMNSVPLVDTSRSDTAVIEYPPSDSTDKYVSRVSPPVAGIYFCFYLPKAILIYYGYSLF